MGMLGIIKEASIGAVGASNPVNVTFGEVLEVENLRIKINQKLILTKEFFVIPETLTRYEIQVDNKTIAIRSGINKGDKVLLLRVQGGQQYVILDKVV